MAGIIRYLLVFIFVVRGVVNGMVLSRMLRGSQKCETSHAFYHFLHANTPVEIHKN